MREDPPPASTRRARLVALALAVGMVVPSVQSLGISTWPFTSWELFSRVRSPHGVTWRVMAVDESGEEETVDLARAGRGLEGWFQISKTIHRLPASELEDTCRAWLAGAKALRPDTTALRVYRYRTSFVPTGQRVERVLEQPRVVATCQ